MASCCLKGFMADSRDYRRWVEYAEENWQVAVSLLDKVSSTTAFLFHESIEKYIKDLPPAIRYLPL
jgi:HEPN domain-containing protein